MSPSKIARLTSATLMGIGALAVAAAAAIGMTGWPPASAYADDAPVAPVAPVASTEGISLSLSAEASLPATEAPPAVTSSTTADATLSVDPTGTVVPAAAGPTLTIPSSKQKTITKAPAAPKVKTIKRTAKKRAAVIRWKRARVSWYGPGFYGNTMAGGGKLRRDSMVVAHRSLPFGTRIQFKYKGRTVVAVVRDRGPYVSGRVFDLGPGTAKRLRFSGVGTVQYRILKRG